jgi:hypothetical protein
MVKNNFVGYFDIAEYVGELQIWQILLPLRSMDNVKSMEENKSPPKDLKIIL